MHVALVVGRDNPAFAAGVDAPLRDALRALGSTVSEPSWNDPDVDWSRFDVTVVRAVWDYTADRDAFVRWAAEAASVTALWNPAEVLRWNTHKSYLLELEDHGAPVVPTAWLATGDEVDLGALADQRGWRRLVIKPAVASGSNGLLRTGDLGDEGELTAAQQHLDGLAVAGDVMVQPYLDAIERDGELSVVLLDGAVSHVIRKQPAPGEFRIQQEFGGRYVPVLGGDAREPSELARWIVEASGHDYLYARVDLLRDEVGTWQLAELEVTEPDLYLGIVPAAADTLARAIIARGS